MKYKQKIIPAVITPDCWKGKKIKELRLLVNEQIKSLAGTEIVNSDTKFSIKITNSSRKKTSFGEAMYYKKAVCTLILPEIIKYAKFNNWGQPKNTDPESLIGYANFKCKCKVDDKIENIRLAVKVIKGGKFYYSFEVNKKR